MFIFYRSVVKFFDCTKIIAYLLELANLQTGILKC